MLASRLRALHEPNSDLRKDLSAVISPGSPLPRINAGLKLTIVLIMRQRPRDSPHATQNGLMRRRVFDFLPSELRWPEHTRDCR